MTPAPAPMFDRIGLASLCVLAALLPFEVRAPLLTVGPVSITNVEVVLYAALAVGAAGWLQAPSSALRPVGWLHAAVLAWLLIVAVSAVLAPVHRDAAVKFAFRTAGAVLLFLATASIVRTRTRAFGVMIALTAGAGLSAAAGVLEAALPGFRDQLMIFREQHSLVGAVHRASGTFDYPNTAAMYWEAVLPLTIASAVWAARRLQSPALRVALMGASILIVLAVVLTLSRAALAVTLFCLLLLFSIACLKVRPMRLHTALVLLGLIAFATGLPTVSDRVEVRLRSNYLPEWYQPAYRVEPSSATVSGGTPSPFQIRVRNDGKVSWPAEGSERIALSYYWKQSQSSASPQFSGARVALPHSVAPGEEVLIKTMVAPPAKAGTYELHFDLIAEHVAWFSALGAATGVAHVKVTPSAHAAIPPFSADSIALPPPRAERRHLWRAALQIWRSRPLFGAGPDVFRHLHGTYLGLEYRDTRTHANSLYVETLANLGLMGIAALMLLMVALARAARTAWNRSVEVEGYALAAGLVAAIAAFLIHGLVDYFLIFTPTYALFWMCCGMLAGISETSGP